MTIPKFIEIQKIIIEWGDFALAVEAYKTMEDVAFIMGCSVRDLETSLNRALPGWQTLPGETLAEKLHDYT